MCRMILPLIFLIKNRTENFTKALSFMKDNLKKVLEKWLFSNISNLIMLKFKMPFKFSYNELKI